MGTPLNERRRAQGNGNQAEVIITTGFWLGKCEVTQGQWKQVMSTQPWEGKQSYHKGLKEGSDYPAIFLTWADVDTFCSKLTAQEQKAKRLPETGEYSLPTEAQWEYGCRAGTKTRFSFGDDETQLGDYAWFQQNTQGVNEDFPHEVGKKKANAWGLHDMHGNVYEMCRDWFDETLPGGFDSEVTVHGQYLGRAKRGASWLNPAFDCTSAHRVGANPKQWSYITGFRVAAIPSE